MDLETLRIIVRDPRRGDLTFAWDWGYMWRYKTKEGSMTKKLSALVLALLFAATGLALAGAAAKENFNEGVTSPYLLPDSRVAPEYPAAAFDARMEGHVTLAALVRADGSVAQVETLDSSAPNLGFEQAGAAAVKQWKFEPGQKQGQVVDAFTVVRLSFRRNGSASGGYVSAGFMPAEMMGASIVVAPPTGDTGGYVLSSAGSLGGPYHPVIPAGLYPGGSYHRSDYWPDREIHLGDAQDVTNPNFDIEPQ